MNENSQLICVTGLDPSQTWGFPKRDLLIFDRIAMLHYQGALESYKRSAHSDPNLISELECLSDKGIIFEPELSETAYCDSQIQECVNKIAYHDSAYRRLINEQLREQEHIFSFRNRSYEKIKKELEKPDSLLKKFVNNKWVDWDRLHRAYEHDSLYFFYKLRLMSIQLQKLNNLDAIVSFPLKANITQYFEDGKEHILQIVLNSMPVPDTTTVLEKILDYRDDPDSKGKFWGLRQWMSDVAKAQLSQNEIVEKLEWLIYQYEQHMKLHELKYNTGTFEIIVTTGAEFIENLSRLKFGSAAKALFALKHKKLELMEAEISAPGKEIAYLVKTRKRFAKRS